MALFSKKNKKKEDTDEFAWMTLNEALARKKMQKGTVTREEVLERCSECCEQLRDVGSKLMETRKEYQSVTTYLSDIEKIEALAGEKKAELADTARTIVRLNNERTKFQETNKGQIAPAQFLQLERFQKEIPDRLREMRELEEYQQKVKDDMKQIEGERGVVTYESEDLQNRRKFMKTLAFAACIIIGIFFVVLFLLSEYTAADMMIPFLMTGILASLIAVYCVAGLGRIQYQEKVNGIKMNKVIQLMNRVKVKYVNCTSSLEFMYEKFHINSSHELAFEWEQFVKILDEQVRYKENTKMLEFYNAALMEMLEAAEIADTEIWIYQPEALLSSKEMVEVRHHLNERRGKVRETLEYSTKHFDIAEEEMQKLLKLVPEYADDMRAMMKAYQVAIKEEA